MMRIVFASSIVAAVLTAAAAQAGELKPIHGKSVALGEVSGMAYYTVEQDGYRLVATMAAGEAGTPIRFVTTLLPGQKAVVSVPRQVGDDAMEVVFSREGDQVVVSDSAKRSAGKVSSALAACIDCTGSHLSPGR